uniref:Cytochrome c oxidase subunit 2 n=1 Tax=Solen grandis TaxID=165599 RepID=G9BY46_9BIVA|nr:cytochrome c oxidase subunit II [Solen grandis]ADV42019.1 cytochrome c oxidase subunit 2 [Solen grandis]
MAEWRQLSFEDSINSKMMNLIFFHDSAMVLIVFVMAVVGFFLVLFLSTGLSFGMNGFTSRFISSNEKLEVFWSTLPAVFLFLLGWGSLHNLYSAEVNGSAGTEPSLNVVVVGHQWYWSYEYYDSALDYSASSVEFDSYLVPEGDLDGSLGSCFRMSEVDNPMVLPSDLSFRLIFSSDDVMHSFYVPSFGLKTDCIPGRLNSNIFSVVLEGVFYGKCAEICGAYHSGMPITVEVISSSDWLGWYEGGACGEFSEFVESFSGS